jgi:hypothetical protein
MGFLGSMERLVKADVVVNRGFLGSMEMVRVSDLVVDGRHFVVKQALTARPVRTVKQEMVEGQSRVLG